jgi:hypothetical protein
MNIGEIINVVLIAILVGTTIYYAIQNKGMKDEMRKERELTADAMRRSIKPNLVLNSLLADPYCFGSTFEGKRQLYEVQYTPMIEIEIENVGLGHAIDVNIEASAILEWELPFNNPPLTIKRLFHFSPRPSPETYPVWLLTIHSGSGIQRMRLNAINSEPATGITSDKIECKLSYSNVLGEKTEHKPIYVDATQCRIKISQIAQEYRLVLGKEVLVVKMVDSGYTLREEERT